jgi:hypothetical protein
MTASLTDLIHNNLDQLNDGDFKHLTAAEKAAITISPSAPAGSVTIDASGNVVITHDLTVQGTTTYLQTQTVQVEDKNIELGKVATPTDVTADGGGITLLGATNKTISWLNADDRWHFNQGIEVDSGDVVIDAGGNLIINSKNVEDHIDSILNPHAVTKAQVGLGNVDNTSDLDKPVSTAQQAALDAKTHNSLVGLNDGDYKHWTAVEKASITIDSSAPAGSISIDASGNVVIAADFTVSGTTTTINTATLEVEDKNIELGKVTTPSDVTADGGGITLLGTTNKTIAWTNSTDQWHFNQGINLTSGNLTLSDGATVGQAAGPLLTFDDSNNFLEITGCDVGLGIASPVVKLDVVGDIKIGTQNAPIITFRTDFSDQLLVSAGGWAYQSGASHNFVLDINNNQSGTSFNVWNHAASGTPLFTVNDSGNVGIGAVSPLGNFEVAQSAAAGQVYFTTWSTNNVHATFLNFIKSGSDTIGSYTATSDGELLGSLAFFGADTSNTLSGTAARIDVEQDGAGGATQIPTRILFKTGTASSNALERMRIDSSGNVGIGTASPASLQSEGTILSLSTAGSITIGESIGNLSFITQDGSFTGTYADGVAGEISVVSESAAGAAYGMVFHTSDISGNRAERVRIDKNGNVGMGTASPSELLEVEKDQNALTIIEVDNNTVGTGAGAGVRIRSDSTSLTLVSLSSGYTTASQFIADGNLIESGDTASGGFGISQAGNLPLMFYTNSTERVRIDGPGNVGIGGTPSFVLDVQPNSTDADTKFIVSTSGGQAVASLFDTSGNQGVRMVSSGLIYINDDANTNMTLGLTINQGANDDEILALKSSDVAHGITTLAETDTYGTIAKTVAVGGGITLTGYSNQTTVNLFHAGASTETSTKSSAAGAANVIQSSLKTGTALGAMAATSNLLSIRNNTSAVVLFEASGDIYTETDQTAGLAGTFDFEDDIMLVNALRYDVKGYKAHNLKRYSKRLQKLGIMSGTMLSDRGVKDLLLGTAGQLFNMMKGLAKEFDIPEKKLMKWAKQYDELAA